MVLQAVFTLEATPTFFYQNYAPEKKLAFSKVFVL